MTISCWLSDSLVFPIVISLVFPFVFLMIFTGSAPFVKDRAIRVLPYIRASLEHSLEVLVAEDAVCPLAKMP